MNIELTESQVAVLRQAIVKQIRETRVELAHTEAPGLQHSLAADLRDLESLADVLDRQLEPGALGPDSPHAVV